MVDMASFQSLRVLFSGARAESLVIVVPDIASLPPEDWHKPTEKPWIKTLSQRAAPRSQFLCFQHGVNSEDTFSWQELLKKAETLLNDLLELRKQSAVRECPIQLICLGMGGLIVKEAIQIAHRQRDHSKDLLSVLSGIVFIGTPHSKLSDEKTWKNISLVPKLRMKHAAKRSMDHGDASRLGILCERFEDLEFDRPILSGYEILPTQVGGTFRSKKVKIVGEDFSKINARTETPFAIDSDYLSLCHLSPRSDAFEKLSEYTQTAIAATQLRIMVQSSQHGGEGGSFHPDRYTVRTQSVAGDGTSAQKDTGEGTTGSTTASYQMVPMVSDFVVSRRTPRLPCYLYGNHTRNKAFFGRAEILRKLKEALLPSSHSHDTQGAKDLHTYSLCGMGGMGKTEIAVEFMYANWSSFDAVFWVQADEPTKLRESFSRIAIELGLEDAADAKDQIVSTNLGKGWLANAIKNPNATVNDGVEEADWLLIFDNVDDPEDLNDFWPQFGGGSVLITSRDPLAKTNVYTTTAGIDLSPFEDEDAAKFLLKLTHTEGTSEDTAPKDALAIARRLGGLPLGLTQMAGVINRKDYTFEEFLRRYEEKSLAKLHSQQGSWQPTGYVHTIASVWALELLSKESMLLLSVISLLDPDGIKEEILTKGAQGLCLEHYPTTDEAYEEARVDLTKRSLVTPNKKERKLRVHRLTQDAARGKMSKDHLHKVFAATVSLLSAAWPYATMSQRHHTARWQTCEELMPSIIRLQDLYTSFVLPGKLFKATIEFARLLTDAAWVISERGSVEKFAQFLDLAQLVCTSQAEDARLILSDIFYARGAEAAETNDKQTAFENNLAFLHLRLEISQTSSLGTKDAKLAQAYNQAANAHLDRGLFDESLNLYGKALEVFHSLEGFSETMTTICVANLGTAYWLLKRYDDAYKILMDNLKAREKVYGVDDTESFRTGRLLHVLGNVLSSQGHLGEAFNFHYRALSQYRSTVGNKHHRTADLCYKVAEHYLRLGQHSSAQALLDQALDIYESREHFKPEVARTKRLMANMFLLMNKFKEASESYSVALQLYRALMPGDSRADENISEADFDGILCFASR